MVRVVLSLQRYEQGKESQSESPLGNEGSQGQGSGYHDPARKEDIWRRTKTRLELWQEHLKDPIIALEKVLKWCLENPYWGWPLVRSFSCCEFDLELPHCPGYVVPGNARGRVHGLPLPRRLAVTAIISLSLTVGGL